MPIQPEGDRVADRVQIGAAMMIDDAFRVAGRARGVIQRDRAPFILRRRPVGGGIALAEKILVFDGAERSAVILARDLDERQVASIQAQRFGRQRREFPIGDQQLRAAVPEDERDRARVQPVVERVQHRAGHRHGVMRLEHRRHVRRQHRDRVAVPDAAPAQRVGEPAAALVELAIREAPRSRPSPGRLDHRELVGINRGGAFEKAERGQRREIRLVAREMGRLVGLLVRSRVAVAHAIVMKAAPRCVKQTGSVAWPSRGAGRCGGFSSRDFPTRAAAGPCSRDRPATSD